MGITISEALARAKSLLSAQNIDSAFIDAELLLSHVLNFRRIDLIMHRDRGLTDREKDAFERLLNRRIKHEPVAYITGIKEFFGRPFKVNGHVLIPRPETEILVEQAVSLAPVGARILEIGVGSGALIVSVLCERDDLKGFGNDISLPSLAIARENARIHGVSDRLALFTGNALESIGISWPMIIANPPYVALHDMGTLEDDVRLYEPQTALFGGNDGLDIVKGIIDSLGQRLAQQGMLIMEVGLGQKEAVEDLVASQSPVKVRSWIKDLAGIDRVVIMERVNG